MFRRNIFPLCVAVLFLAGCSSSSRVPDHISRNAVPPTPSQGTFKVGKPYKVLGKWYTPREDYALVETGIASWYGPNFHGKMTANGEIFDQNELTAAHRTLHMPSIVRVTNLENGRSLVVRVNDRGPFKRGRIIDLSKRAAELLGFRQKGTAKVRVQVLTQESKEVAEIAKRGHDTSGFETALNEPKRAQPVQRQEPLYTRQAQQQGQISLRDNPTPILENTQTQQGASLKPVDRVQLGDVNRPLTGHTKNGNFYPDQIVNTVAVPDTGIFVQAAAFGSKDNAVRYAQQLSQIAETKVVSAVVNGQTVHRVRFGPLKDVAQADDVLARLVANGNQKGLIIVE